MTGKLGERQVVERFYGEVLNGQRIEILDELVAGLRRARLAADRRSRRVPGLRDGADRGPA
jgi:hypothetical protein